MDVNTFLRTAMDAVRTGCAILIVLILAWSACVQTSQVRVPVSMTHSR